MIENEYFEKCITEHKGSNYVLRGYIYTQTNNFNDLIIHDLGFIDNEINELQLFKDTLLKANIKEFILTEKSTALMDILHALDSIGIILKGVAVIEYIDNLRVRPKKEIIKGLKMEVVQ